MNYYGLLSCLNGHFSGSMLVWDSVLGFMSRSFESSRAAKSLNSWCSKEFKK